MAVRAFGAIPVGGKRRNPIDVSDDSVQLDPPASIYLEGESARKLFSHDVGEPVQGTIKGRVTSKSVEEYPDPNGERHCMRLEVTTFSKKAPDTLSEVTELMMLLEASL